MLALLALLLAPPALPAAIEEWRRHLRQEFGLEVPIVWAGSQLEGESGGFDLAMKQLENENFRRQFLLMQAAMISEQTAKGQRFAVVVNESWRPFWEGEQAALVGHELGHVWLRARRLPSPAYSGGALGCLAVHAGDIVQHVLIRAEMDRRGIDHRPLFMKNLDASAAALEERGVALDDCVWVRQAALWVDARLAFHGGSWPGRQRFEAAAGQRFPESERSVEKLLRLLAGKDLNDRLVHRQALVDVFAVLNELAAEQRKRDARRRASP